MTSVGKKIRPCLAIESNRTESRTEKSCEKETRRRVTINNGSRDDIYTAELSVRCTHDYGHLRILFRATSLAARDVTFSPSDRCEYIFHGAFHCICISFGGVFCTLRLLSSTPLRLNKKLAVDKSLIQFLEFASARVPDHPSHSRCLIFRAAPREFFSNNPLGGCLYASVYLSISLHGVKF